MKLRVVNEFTIHNKLLDEKEPAKKESRQSFLKHQKSDLGGSMNRKKFHDQVLSVSYGSNLRRDEGFGLAKELKSEDNKSSDGDNSSLSL